MSNPYESPEWREPAPPPTPLVPHLNPGLVSHVRIVCILMMLQGALEIVLGAMFLLLAVLVESIYFVVGGAPCLIAGAFHLYAGIVNFNFRSRMIGNAALILGLGSSLACFSAPTTLALTVYGLIVFFDKSVVFAFELGDEGRPGREIVVIFYPPLPPPQPYDPPLGKPPPHFQRPPFR